MEASVKIELPTYSRDKDTKREYVKNILYDMEFLKNKNIKEWQEEGGREIKDKCAIFSGEPTDRPIVFAMSKDDLVEKLTRLKVISIVK